jgi:Autotransporter beta-domain
LKKLSLIEVAGWATASFVPLFRHRVFRHRLFRHRLFRHRLFRHRLFRHRRLVWAYLSLLAFGLVGFVNDAHAECTTTVSIVGSPNPSKSGQTVTFTTTVTLSAPGGCLQTESSYGSYGVLNITADQSTPILTNATLRFVVATGNGTATVTASQSSLSPGAHTITATFTPSFDSILPGTGRTTQVVGSGNSQDSQNLRTLQVGVTKIVAGGSGAAITGAVDAAIGDAFSAAGGAPITVGPSGITINFAAEPESEVARRTDEAFSALGYRGNVYNFASASQPQMASRADEAFSALGYAGNVSTRVPPRVNERVWSAWADVRGTGFDQSNVLADTHGSQLNVTGGVARLITPDILVGLFTGFEHFNFTVESLAGKMSGDGGTVGAYAAYAFGPHWRADGMIGWSDIWYSGTAGTASGSFTGARWLGSAGLTGEYRWAAFVLQPSTRIYTLWESENAWTDSLGTVQPSRNFSESRMSTGGKMVYPWQSSGMQISPYLGLYGDYRFSTDNALPVGVPFVGIKDGWSGRATTGLTFATSRGGPSVSLGGELGGIGAGYDIWSANARVSYPF